MRIDAIDAAIADLRQLHPELREPLTWLSMSAILQREGITLITIPLVHDAQVISCDGVSVIAINSNAPVVRHTYFAAHEYGHIKLHFKEPHEIVYHTSACWPEDPREDDAEYFATSLLMGPQRLARSAASTVDAVEGTVTRYKDAGDGRRLVHTPKRRVQRASPAQTILPLPPEPALPHEVIAVEVRDDAVRAMLKATSPRLRARLVARERRERAQQEATLDLRPRVEHVGDGKQRKHYLVDRDGVRWRIWDLMPPGRRSSSPKLVRVEPPHNWAEERAFVQEDGTQRRYSFKYRESRELQAAALERQLLAAAK